MLMPRYKGSILIREISREFYFVESDLESAKDRLKDEYDRAIEDRTITYSVKEEK